MIPRAQPWRRLSELNVNSSRAMMRFGSTTYVPMHVRMYSQMSLAPNGVTPRDGGNRSGV